MTGAVADTTIDCSCLESFVCPISTLSSQRYQSPCTSVASTEKQRVQAVQRRPASKEDTSRRRPNARFSHPALYLNPRCQMRRSHKAHLSAILAAAAISLSLLVSTSSAVAASPKTRTSIGAQPAWLRALPALPALSVGSVSFAPSDRQGAMSANWTVGCHDQRERGARDRRHHHDQCSRLDDLPLGEVRLQRERHHGYRDPDDGRR